MKGVPQRQLRSLVAQVGAGFRRRASPPPAALLALLILLLAAAMAAGGARLLVSAWTVLLCVWMLPGGRRFAVPLCLLAAMALLPSLALAGASGKVLAPAQLDLLCGSAIAAALLLLAVHLLRLQQFSRRLQRCVDGMGEAQLLALLPPEAVRDARRWLAGQGQRCPGLALVLELAALHAAMAMCRRRRLPRAVVPG